MRENQLSALSGCVPSAIRRALGILPMLVRNAAIILSALDASHCAGSSASIRVGASPCARLGSLPMHRTAAPVGLWTMLARCGVSFTWNIALSSEPPCRALRNASTWSNAILAWLRLDATIIVSPRDCRKHAVNRRRSNRRA